MDTEDQILKGTKFLKAIPKIPKNKFLKAKIKNLEQSLDSQKYNIKKNYKKYKKYI